MADQKKTYTVTTATTPARPRSKARRDGTGLTSGGASAIIESSTAGNAQRASHANTADEAAHALRADEAARAATAKTAEHATTADRATAATRADEATHAATATNATTAERANTANTADTATRAQTADHAATAARAEQAQRATEAETLRTPNYSDGLTTGAGARIDATGNAEFQSMAVRGFFRAAEYQINRIALSEGDVFHTENGLVKSAERQADGRWKVVLQERFQGDVTGFRVGDILRGAYNGIGTSGGAAEIRTSWLRVEAVDAKAGTLTASLYADNQTPEGRNAPPIALMRLARWGNTTDPERQSHIVESATDGRIVRRVKVSAPIVDGAQSDGFVVGKLPAWLREHFGAAVADASDYVFARGIITQNILRYTPAGRPLAERVDRGLWSASSRYFYEQQNPETGAFEISRVWHDGALYELARGGNGNTAPAAQSTHWTLIQAKPKDGDKGDAGESYHPNLLENSAFTKGFDYWNPEGRWGVIDDTEISPVQGTRVVRIDTAMLGALPFVSFYQGVGGRLRPNTTYTLSVWVKTSQELKKATILFAFKPFKFLDISYQHGGEWTRCAITFTTFPEKNDNQSIRLRLNRQEGAASVWFAAPKLEVGDTPTEWTTSENDRKGEKGKPGKDGKSSYTHVAYSNSPDGKPCTLDPKGEKFAYLGTYTDENKDASKDPARYVWAKVQGEKGDKGDKGRGIERVEAFYKLTEKNTAPSLRESGWTNEAPQPTTECPWLWHRELTEYTNGQTTQTEVRLIGHYGKDGTNGTSIRAQYSADAQTWHDDFAEGDVWMRTGNGTTWGGALRVVGESGADGKDGLTPNANLLDDTDFKNLGRKESAWGVGTHGEEPIGGRANADLFPPSVSGCYPALCSINPGTKQGEYAQLWQNIGRPIPGRTYTFSVYVRGASDAWLIVYPTPTEHFRPNTVKPDEWTRVSLTFTVPKTKATEDTLIILRAWHREEQPHKGFAKNVVWCAPKLEEGGVPTPWTPSRNDLRGNDGAPGARGAVVRQFGDYAKLPDGTAFESGHAGEQYVDVVQVRQGAQVQFYQCKQPHTKSADKVPAADSEWWELGMYQGFIATDLFLAKLSLIKNLQVENVVGRDANGNTTFDLDASTGTAYFGGTATFAGFIRRRPVVITPDNWEQYGGVVERGVIYLNPFRVGTYVIFRGNFGTLRPTINTGGAPLNDGAESVTPDDSQAMRYYGAQFMVFNDLEPRPNTLLTVGGLTIGSKQTAIFTMKGRNHADPSLWWHGELLQRW